MTLNERSLRKMIYGALSAKLRQSCVIDTISQDFIDQCFPVQEKMAAEFERKAEGAPPCPAE